MTARAYMPLVLFFLLSFSRIVRAEEAETREEQYQRASALLEQEPSVSDVRAAALRYLRVDPEFIANMRRRVQAKSALPYVRLGSRLEQYRAIRWIQDEGVVGNQVNSEVQFVSLRSRNYAMLAYDLPTAVSTPSNLQLYQQSNMSITISRMINTFYFHRRQLILYFMVDPPQDPRAYDALRIRIQGYTSLLNTFTGGWFGQQLPEGAI